MTDANNPDIALVKTYLVLCRGCFKRTDANFLDNALVKAT